SCEKTPSKRKRSRPAPAFRRFEIMAPIGERHPGKGNASPVALGREHGPRIAQDRGQAVADAVGEVELERRRCAGNQHMSEFMPAPPRFRRDRQGCAFVVLVSYERLTAFVRFQVGQCKTDFQTAWKCGWRRC